MPINHVSWKSIFQHRLAVQIRNLIRFWKHVWDCVGVPVCHYVCMWVWLCARAPVEVTSRSQKRELSLLIPAALCSVLSLPSCPVAMAAAVKAISMAKGGSWHLPVTNLLPRPSPSLPPPGSWPAGEPAWGSEVNGLELQSDSERWRGKEWERDELHHTDGEERWENEKMRPNLITIKRWGCARWRFCISENGCYFAQSL